MRKIEKELTFSGFAVVAISPDKPEKLLDFRKAKEIGYHLYSDSSLAAAKAFGIAFQLSDETLARYAGFGIDLDEASGQDHHQLPVPSAFLVDGSGTIRWSYSNPDYRIRPDNKTIVEAAHKLRPKPSVPSSENRPIESLQ